LIKATASRLQPTLRNVIERGQQKSEFFGDLLQLLQILDDVFGAWRLQFKAKVPIIVFR